MTDEMYDVAICGGGPAGATAAILLASLERNVVLIDAAKSPRKGGNCAWVGSKATDLLQELGVHDDKIFSDSFTSVTFYSADFTKNITPAFSTPAGFLLNRADLENLLLKKAKKAGAEVIDDCPIEKLLLEEKRAVVVGSKGRQMASRMLLLATGRSSPLVRQCGFTTGGSGLVLWAAQVDEPLRKGASQEPSVHVVLGLNKQGSFGLICNTPKQLSISVHWIGEKREATPGLINLCKMALDATVVASPASAALEHDSHVGKHSLLIGDAGGFVAAASNEGIYPAMWSAKIASDVIHSALENTYSQDELMSFDSKWRIEMADYLRSPNTDPQFLLPLVFSNQAMADRMGAAFFSGENI
ncbi:MAG: NAD(P)/FAD-dependent oxidoreductase [Planctomycetota bacterium]|jgi:flavin-dependent dehydrogenase